MTLDRHRSLAAITFLVGSIVLLGCGTDGPAFPEVESTDGGIAGVVWFDDNGNGEIDGSEEGAAAVSVQVGLGTQPTAHDRTLTDERGGFIVDLQNLVGLDAGALDLFVQATQPVAGPVGREVDVHIRVAAELGDVQVMVALAPLEACEDPLDTLLDGQSSCGAALLPDLTPMVEDFGQPPTQAVAAASASVDSSTLAGTTLLRFASATANLGAGPLHMIPGDMPQNGAIPTWQRIWTSDNQFVDHATGEFIYHETHEHFHLEAFEQYRLLSLDGDVVAVGEKVSFCLIDSLPAVTGAQTRGRGIFLDAVCEQAGEQQALNPGWADYYGAGLDDQWIDITGVVPGDYLVEIVVDPDNILIESDETNNRATFPVTIDASGQLAS